ncbi:MAG: chloride channel protein [Sphingobacteriia bacterium]|nr:MAG: chloride channel protein [Sphingobacteriia bacterium]TAH07457.1 MAG: chloride channel protein [Sphingobacteriia bacterium]
MSNRLNNFSFLTGLVKWFFIIIIIGVIAGTSAAFFLASLNWITKYREMHLWMIAFLPVAGLVSGLLYYYYGKEFAAGNKLLINAIHEPKGIIPIFMAPMIYINTLITHLFGGSAGREGTALQIAASLSDQFSKPLNLSVEDRKILLLAAVAAGFGAVFGTPIAGAVFALEFCLIKKFNSKIFFVVIASSILSNCIAMLLNTKHTSYPIRIIPSIGFIELIWTIIAGIAFGVCAVLFNTSMQKLSGLFKKYIVFAPLQPMIGGFLIAIAVYLIGTTKYIGLGIPTMVAAFTTTLPYYDFILKMAFTILTLAAGFKGGEATPLFFIGAALGNCLSLFIPLPFALLSGMGFVAVFAGVMNTPLACAIMAVELFGIHAGFYAALACLIACGVGNILSPLFKPNDPF